MLYKIIIILYKMSLLYCIYVNKILSYKFIYIFCNK